ncbi:MAG: hypothetical protein CL959_01575 [Euryarchaeota archaeon]|nr:hypothetical protein [Euryarchaeota archaeon]|tara:strand:+ start:194 stop:1345 length:1152 start_codon:yes stop_codon:yes gene_type:complete
MTRSFSADAIELIKEFEGLALTAYLCPSKVWSLGYGRTNGVKSGDTCTAEQAELWLIDDMDWANDAVNDYIRGSVPQAAHDALVSFTYNVGAGALSESTLARRINAGEPVIRVIEEELPRWVNGANGPLVGLVRRREAEVALAQTSEEIEVVEPRADNSISLVNAATYFKNLPHQTEAFEYLEDLLTLEELDEFARIYRDGIQSSHRTLKVRHMIQLDNGPYGYRQCFTTSCAMLLEYLRPGTLSGPNGDLEYLETVEQYGDTTDASAQVKALRSYGLDVEFVTDASWETLEDQIRKGLPVPCGWLHKGSSSSPSGGGHWSVVVGMTEAGVVMNDPLGEADLVNGGYVDHWITAGQSVSYSERNWRPRWEVEGPASGWAIIAR